MFFSVIQVSNMSVANCKLNSSLTKTSVLNEKVIFSLELFHIAVLLVVA